MCNSIPYFEAINFTSKACQLRSVREVLINSVSLTLIWIGSFMQARGFKYGWFCSSACLHFILTICFTSIYYELEVCTICWDLTIIIYSQHFPFMYGFSGINNDYHCLKKKDTSLLAENWVWPWLDVRWPAFWSLGLEGIFFGKRQTTVRKFISICGMLAHQQPQN